MNICVLSGQIQSNAIVRGKKTKALVFTVATRQLNSNGNGHGESDSEGISSYVPCVVFNPPSDLELLLTTQGQGKEIELQGRISAPRPEAHSEPRSNAEVVVYTKSLRIFGLQQ